MATEKPKIIPLQNAIASDTIVVSTIVRIINDVFDETEADLLVPNTKRTNYEEIVQVIKKGEMHAAYRGDEIVGVVRVYFISNEDGQGGHSNVRPTVFAAANEMAEQHAPRSDEDQKFAFNYAQVEEKRRGSVFGMLSVPRSYRSTGLGRDLVLYAENYARSHGSNYMEITLLVPIDEIPHQFKVFLSQWYTRLGYQAVAWETTEDFLMKVGKNSQQIVREGRTLRFETWQKSL